MDTHGNAWTYMETHGNSWTYMEMHGYIWKHMECMEMPGNTWTHMEMHGNSWTHMETYGNTWKSMFTHVHTPRAPGVPCHAGSAPPGAASPGRAEPGWQCHHPLSPAPGVGFGRHHRTGTATPGSSSALGKAEHSQLAAQELFACWEAKPSQFPSASSWQGCAAPPGKCWQSQAAPCPPHTHLGVPKAPGSTSGRGTMLKAVSEREKGH